MAHAARHGDALCCGRGPSFTRCIARASASPPFLVRLSLARILLPLFALITIAFALLQLFSGGLAFREGQMAMGAFYCLMGVGGGALATALWRARSR